MSSLTEEQKEEQRQHKRRQRARNRDKFNVEQQASITRAKEANALKQFDTLTLLPFCFDWASVPSPLDPQYNLEGERGLRKRQQAVSFARAIKPLIDDLSAKHQRRLKIVDFGCGTGNGSLPLAYWFRDQVDFIMIDKYKAPIKILNERVTSANLSNVTSHCQFINDFKSTNTTFDIGFASHACGSASDDALATCLSVNASFVIISCCVGKLKHAEDDVLPRSAWMRKILSRDEFLQISRAADHAKYDFSENVSEWKRDCKLLLEIDRLALARESNPNFELFIGKLDPITCSVKNDIIWGYLP